MTWMSYDSYDEVEWDELVGKTLTEVKKSSDEIDFYTECGEHYRMLHIQDCCEHVYVDSIDGDIYNLVGDPIRMASCSTEDGSGEDAESLTWTFYRIRTAKEFCHITWRGSSNGYYSERVKIIKMKKGDEDGNP